MDRNQLAPDKPEETTETLDPNETWSPQPSTLYQQFDAATEEGQKRPGDSAIDRAAAGIAANAEHAGDPVEMQGHVFVPAEHEVQRNSESGGVKTDLECDIGLRSGQGQSGLRGDSSPVVLLPNVGRTPDGEISIVELPPDTRNRPGT
jgi:hypothetical protein